MSKTPINFAAVFLLWSLFVVSAFVSSVEVVRADPAVIKQGCFGRIGVPACNGSSPAALAAARRGKMSSPAMRVIGTPLPSAISYPVFHQITSSTGEWSGTVSGHGDVYLTLQILVRGALQSSRSIGSVHLVDHSTTFHFRSATPPLRGWDWKIVAFTRAAPPVRRNS